MNRKKIAHRFRGFLPVVIDVETAGFNCQTDALLELAAIEVDYDENNRLVPVKTHHYHIEPFPGANLEASALNFLGVDPTHPFRFAVSEREALSDLFTHINAAIKTHHCQRAILVGHNAFFDLTFLQAATLRCGIKDSPFHRFTTLDTASLGALVYGQTVLARALKAAHIPFDQEQAHSALYDTESTAQLFCTIVNKWDELSLKTPGL
ncbi:MAG TPA: ribonuclease T [Gammaproteobacteria bacterium]|nr:ribonuclease T [Gammaproteobacteria bacterium]